MVVVALHQIGSSLYNTDVGVHKHQLHDDWVAHAKLRESRGERLGHALSSCAFAHSQYCDSD